MFAYAAVLAVLPLSLAAPVTEHLAPIHRAVDVSAQSANGGHIVALKPNSVNPNNRGEWLNKVLSAGDVTLDQATNQSLKLKWSDKVFNGVAGTFSNEALNVLRKLPEVAWIQEGPSVHCLVGVAIGG